MIVTGFFNDVAFYCAVRRWCSCRGWRRVWFASQIRPPRWLRMLRRTMPPRCRRLRSPPRPKIRSARRPNARPLRGQFQIAAPTAPARPRRRRQRREQALLRLRKRRWIARCRVSINRATMFCRSLARRPTHQSRGDRNAAARRQYADRQGDPAGAGRVLQFGRRQSQFSCPQRIRKRPMADQRRIASRGSIGSRTGDRHQFRQQHVAAYRRAPGPVRASHCGHHRHHEPDVFRSRWAASATMAAAGRQ